MSYYDVLFMLKFTYLEIFLDTVVMLLPIHDYPIDCSLQLGQVTLEALSEDEPSSTEDGALVNHLPVVCTYV